MGVLVRFLDELMIMSAERVGEDLRTQPQNCRCCCFVQPGTRVHQNGVVTRGVCKPLNQDPHTIREGRPSVGTRSSQIGAGKT